MDESCSMGRLSEFSRNVRKPFFTLAPLHLELARLHREVEAFYQYLSPTDEEHHVRSMIIKSIENAVVAAFPDAQIKPFGSFETRLYLPMG